MWRWGDSEAFVTPNITSSQFVELPEAGWRSNSCPNAQGRLLLSLNCTYIYINKERETNDLTCLKRNESGCFLALKGNRSTKSRPSR